MRKDRGGYKVIFCCMSKKDKLKFEIPTQVLILWPQSYVGTQEGAENCHLKLLHLIKIG